MRLPAARVAVLLVVAAALLSIPSRPAAAATTTIDVGTTWFCNSSYQLGVCETTVAIGDTVTWNFTGGIYSIHTSTHCGADCDNPTATPLWDSGARVGGQTYSYTFTQAGTYLYQCSLHLNYMRGRIVVLSPVGGIAELAEVDAGTPLEQPGSSGADVGFWAALAAATAAFAVALGGAARLLNNTAGRASARR